MPNTQFSVEGNGDYLNLNWTSIYVESVYMMTTTITKVGFGDEYFKGFPDNSSEWMAEMLYLYFIMLLGTVLFSIVTNEIFSYRKLLTIKEMLRNRTADVDLFL